ncbi:MAG: TIGR04283 family arsenosugar biosynthesis glycosyltransferase [Janthinobacterium lividum]
MKALSIIIPTFDEAKNITALLEQLSGLRARGAQIIVADGGSSDNTLELAEPLSDLIVKSARGRAQQLNAGARHARGDAMLFLEADTRLPESADEIISEALQQFHWGRFDLDIAGSNKLLPLLARTINLRSRLTGIATSEQAMFVKRALFHHLGGFDAIATMEDVELSKRLKRAAMPACLHERVVSSGKRWENHAMVRTALLHGGLRAA